MNAIIIDDEPHCRNVIERILENHCPDIAVVATCADGIEGLKAILQLQPDIVFLDVEMPRMNGLQMLEALGKEDLKFTLIFTTAYDKFAVQAFKFSAFDYLLKPIDDDELIRTMQKLENVITPAAQIQHLRDNLNANGLYNKLTIATTRGITFLEIADIVALEADSNYTKIYLVNGETILASKTLGYFDDLLSDRRQFFRTHKQYIINLAYIKEYLSGENNLVLLRNGLQIRLARTRRQAFLELFKL
ncbi:MAG: Transcriptional regulatory protein BtsR [Haliscomenobacter sp.]|jgi:two-component system LytT family response regulator|nr:Transcriptional regulatory protein BtsR [Haliscomenobacter sp.]